ncbi:MAG: hypothetical protein ON057_001823 [Glomeribacter sp. 1016415]|nr:hypothetical protein [Glomeribacter sp. 1016415]
MGNTKNSESDLAVFTSIWIPEFDRKPAGISLAEIAETNAFIASVCRQ